MSQLRATIRSRTSGAIDRTTARALLLSLGIALVVTFFIGWISPERQMEAIDADFANLFLATIAQVLGGALAIVFSVSALVITMIADRYTHQLVSKFATDPLTIITFLALLTCTLVALIFIGISLPMYKWGFLGMVFFVNFGLVLMAQYLLHALHLIKPSTMSHLLSTDALKLLEKQDDNGLFKVLSSIGDVVFKAIERGEEDIAEDYLRALHRIHIGWIASDRKPLQGTYDQSLVTLGIERRSPVLNQYKRIFKVLMDKNNEILARLIENLVAESVASLTDCENESLTLKGLLKQHRELAELAIEHRNSSRFGFLHSYRSLIWYTGRFKRDYLDLCLNAFVEICSEIMVQDDWELWDHTLNFFSSGYHSIQDLYTSLENDHLARLVYPLAHQDSQQNWQWLLAWKTWVLNTLKPRLIPHRRSLLILSLEGISNSLNSEHPAQEQISQINEHLTRVDTTTHLIDAFFRIGIKALALEKHKYIKSLWQPSDSLPRIDYAPPDLGFAIMQTLFYVRSNRYFFFEPEEMAVAFRYCFINFAYAWHRSAQREWCPKIPNYRSASLSRYGVFSEAVAEDLRYLYRLLTNFQNDVQPFLEQYDFIANNHADWNDMFDGNAAGVFQEARHWLLDEKRQQYWSNTTSELIEVLSVDVRQRLQCFTHIRRTHQATSRVAQLAEVIPLTRNSAAQKHLDSRVPCDKIHLTVLGDFQPHSDASFQAASLGGSLAKQEEIFIMQTILENENVHVMDSERLTFAALVAGATQVRNSGIEPTVLITSIEQIHDAFDNDQDFRTHVRPIDGQRQVVIDGTTRLLILELFHKVNYALILAPASGHWSVTEPVKPSIIVCPHDPLRLYLKAEEIVQYQLVREEGVVILRFSHTPTDDG